MSDEMPEIDAVQQTIQEDTDFLLKEMVDGAQGYILLMVDKDGVVTPRVHGLSELESLGTLEMAKGLFIADALALVSEADDDDEEVDFEKHPVNTEAN